MDVWNCSKNWEIIKEQLEEEPVKTPSFQPGFRRKKKGAKQKIPNP